MDATLKGVLGLLAGADVEARCAAPVILTHLRCPEDRVVKTPLDRHYLTQLNRLAESSQPLVKRFAVQKLAGLESASVVKTLIGYLTDDSYARRDHRTATRFFLTAPHRAARPRRP